MQNVYEKQKTIPKVSIVTASYNYENYIKETIESVINQTISDWEMIIVDDGSQDNSVNVINEYCKKDDRIKLYTHKNNENKGLSETIKLGIEKATTDWIIFLESDDFIDPKYIEEKMNIIKDNPDIKYIYNDVNMFGDSQRIKKMQKYFKKMYSILNNTSFPADLLKYFYEINLVPTFSCVMLRKEILENVDWDACDKRCLDYYLWVQIAKKYKFYYLNKKLTNWRMSKSSYINMKYPKESTYFFNVQVPSVIFERTRFRDIIKYVVNLIKMYRRKIISVKLNKREKSLSLFGKVIFSSIDESELD